MSWSIFLFTGLRLHLVPENTLEGPGADGCAFSNTAAYRRRSRPVRIATGQRFLKLRFSSTKLEPSPWLQVVVHQDKASRQKESVSLLTHERYSRQNTESTIKTIVEIPASSPPCPPAALMSGPASSVQNTNATRVDGI